MLPRHGASFTPIAIGRRREPHSFPVFFVSFMAIFLLAGMGNGSTYRMIPAIFGALGRSEAADRRTDLERTALGVQAARRPR